MSMYKSELLVVFYLEASPGSLCSGLGLARMWLASTARLLTITLVELSRR